MPAASTLAIPSLVGTAPPPAKPLSFFEQLRAAKGNPFETIPLAAYEQPVYHDRSPFGRMLWVNDPEGVRRVLLDNVANYPKHEFEVEFLSAMFGEGLLSTDGEKWRAHRRVMAPSFDPRTVASYAPAMVETAREFFDHWEALAGKQVDIAEEMKAITLEIVCRTMFSSDAGELVGVAGKVLATAQESLNFGLLEFSPVIGPIRLRTKERTVHARFATLDEAVYRMIRTRSNNLSEAPHDLLTRLIAARDPESGIGMTAKEVRDQVVTIFMAGHETTAVAMTFVWYLLSLHPAVEEKLHAELDAVLGGRTPSAEDVPALPYTRMIIEEAMRIYPPAPALSLRVARKDDEICGVMVRAGTRVLISPWILHRHRRLWDEPERFDPERFSAERSVGRSRFAFLPFGGGPRVCIGAAFAMTEAVAILSVLAQRFRPRLAEGQEIKLQSRITLRPRGGIKMTLERIA